MAARGISAFAPGRVNVIGEHTDYNDGLALPFAIAVGVTVTAVAAPAPEERAVAGATPGAARWIEAAALDLGESDRFELDAPRPEAPEPVGGWRGFVRGAAAELAAAGYPLAGGRLEIAGSVPRGAGLSSSAALAVAVCLALIELGSPGHGPLDRIALARLCSRVENDWTGANTGLLDQLASLCGETGTALLIDFGELRIEPVPLALGAWRFAIADSGERHEHAGSGYNDRRSECAEACALLGVGSLREVRAEQLGQLPERLQRRARHVLEENERVLAAVAALRAHELGRLGPLLDASHASLRDLYEVSTPRVEAAVQRMLDAGASGARLIGGGFGGSVLGLFAPGAELPSEALEVRPGPGAHLLAS